MRLPQKPPSTKSISQKIGIERFSVVIQQAPLWSTADKYLHWNELRYRKAPAGYTHEEWWMGLRVLRSTNRYIELRDLEGKSFSFGQPDSLAELLHKIDRGLGTVLGLPEALEGSDTRDRYVINSLIQEAITSSQLEGAVTTRKVAQELLRTGRPPRDKSERMILNNYRTMQSIREMRGHELTPQMVMELHSRITLDTLDKPDAAGRFRKSDEDIYVGDDEDNVFHRPPPAEQLPVRLEAMCEFANGRGSDAFIHPVIRAIILHFWLAYDHPFVDGNGRTARALFYWAMLREKYELFEFISISEVLLQAPTRYYEAFLFTETDGNDLNYFLLHQAEVIHKAVNNLNEYLQRKKAELKAASQYLQAMQDLNHRQQALLTHALRERSTRYLIGAHMNSHGVTHQTARADLFDLVERGLLVVAKAGRGYVFRAPTDLQDKLRHSSTALPQGQDESANLNLGLKPQG